MRRFTVIFLMLVLSGCTLDLHRWMPTNVIYQPDHGDAQRGADIFVHGVGDAPPCISCHSIGTSVFSLGPVMIGISQRAGQRVPGLSADAYIRQSILDPSAYVVSGYRNIMYPDFKNKLSAQDLADLIAYLKTL